MTEGPVRTRFAPSPTGELHVGSARTALFNYLFARGRGGAFILRIEDTDPERSARAFEDSILRDLRWLGLEWDEGPDVGGPHGPYRQSERGALYAERAAGLLDAGAAYRCYCSLERLGEVNRARAEKGLPPRYDGRCRDLGAGETPAGARPVIRFRVPGGRVAFTDGVHGPMEFDPSAMGDFIIIASDGAPTYNFAAVVDDSSMAVTHVIRGDDHLPNTPRQILLYEALGLAVPEFFHVPLVLGPDRAPLGKRHGGATLAELRDEGFLPGAVVNAMARLGWSPPEGLLTLDELTGEFDAKRLSASPSVFDRARLAGYNRAEIEKTPAAKLVEMLPGSLKGEPPPEGLEEVVEAVKANASTLVELAELARPFAGPLSLTEEARAALSGPGAEKVLKALLAETERVQEFEGTVPAEVIGRVKAATGEAGRALFMPIRLALTGVDHGIELTRVLELLKKDRVAERLARALEGDRKNAQGR